MDQQRIERHRPRRLSILGPMILITLGVLLLLNNFGLLPWGFWSNLWRFWPVFLILLGIEFLFSRSYAWLGLILAILVVVAIIVFIALFPVSGKASPGIIGPSASQSIISEELGNLTSASVNIDFGAGDIVIGSLPSESGNLVEAGIMHGQMGRTVRKEFSRSNGQGHLTLRPQGDSSFQFGGNLSDSWDVKLTPTLPLDLHLKTGASQNMVDLSDLNVRQLRVEVGAGSANIKLPKQGVTTARVQGGASSISLEIPESMAARIDAKLGLGSLNIDETRFLKRDRYYVSDGFDSATNKIDLSIEGGLASISVR